VCSRGAIGPRRRLDSAAAAINIEVFFIVEKSLSAAAVAAPGRTCDAMHCMQRTHWPTATTNLTTGQSGILRHLGWYYVTPCTHTLGGGYFVGFNRNRILSVKHSYNRKRFHKRMFIELELTDNK